MKITDNELNTISQALSYAVMYAKTEPETAEFAIIKVKVESEINKRFYDKQLREKTLCKVCNRSLDKNAIISTGLCTACFTSNA